MSKFCFEVPCTIDEYDRMLRSCSNWCSISMYYDNKGSFFTEINKNKGRIIAYQSIDYQNKKGSSLVFKGKIKSILDEQIEVKGRFTLPTVFEVFVWIPIVVISVIMFFSGTTNIIGPILILSLWVVMSFIIKRGFLQYTKVRNIELIELLQMPVS